MFRLLGAGSMMGPLVDVRGRSELAPLYQPGIWEPTDGLLVQRLGHVVRVTGRIVTNQPHSTSPRQLVNCPSWAWPTQIGLVLADLPYAGGVWRITTVYNGLRSTPTLANLPKGFVADLDLTYATTSNPH